MHIHLLVHGVVYKQLSFSLSPEPHPYDHALLRSWAVTTCTMYKPSITVCTKQHYTQIQVLLITIVCTLYPSDVALAVVILGTGVISLPLTIVLCCIMKLKNFVKKGGEHLT